MAVIDQNLLAELRAIRSALATAKARDVTPIYLPAARAIARLETRFVTPLRLAVLGEGNSGKSLLINYLLKHQILPSDGFAGEGIATLIRFAPEPSVHSICADGSRNRLTSRAFGRLIKPENPSLSSPPTMIYDAENRGSSAAMHAPNTAQALFGAPQQAPLPLRLIEVGLPLPLLQHLEVFELRNAPTAAAEGPASRAFREVGLAIWCTLATQAWKETETLAWKRIPKVHRRSALMLVTYRDAIRSEKDETKILARLHRETASQFDEIAIVSLRDAVQSLISSDEEETELLRLESRIEKAESAIAAMMQQRQTARLERAARLLNRIAERLTHTSAPCSSELATRIRRLAAAFRQAQPSISLAVQAA